MQKLTGERRPGIREGNRSFPPSFAFYLKNLDILRALRFHDQVIAVISAPRTFFAGGPPCLNAPIARRNTS